MEEKQKDMLLRMDQLSTTTSNISEEIMHLMNKQDAIETNEKNNAISIDTFDKSKNINKQIRSKPDIVYRSESRAEHKCISDESMPRIETTEKGLTYNGSDVVDGNLLKDPSLEMNKKEITNLNNEDNVSMQGPEDLTENQNNVNIEKERIQVVWGNKIQVLETSEIVTSETCK